GTGEGAANGAGPGRGAHGFPQVARPAPGGGFRRGLRENIVAPEPSPPPDCPSPTSMISHSPAERPPTTRGGTAAGSGGRTVSGSGLAPRTSCPARPHLADRYARGWESS